MVSFLCLTVCVSLDWEISDLTLIRYSIRYCPWVMQRNSTDSPSVSSLHGITLLPFTRAWVTRSNDWQSLTKLLWLSEFYPTSQKTAKPPIRDAVEMMRNRRGTGESLKQYMKTVPEPCHIEQCFRNTVFSEWSVRTISLSIQLITSKLGFPSTTLNKYMTQQ